MTESSISTKQLPALALDQPPCDTRLTLSQVSRRLRISEDEIGDMMNYEGIPYFYTFDEGPFFSWPDVVDWLKTEIIFRESEWDDTPTARDTEILWLQSTPEKEIAQ